MENKERMSVEEKSKLGTPPSGFDRVEDGAIASLAAGMPNLQSKLEFDEAPPPPTFQHQAAEHQTSLAVALSMPSSPSGLHIEVAKRVMSNWNPDLALDPPAASALPMRPTKLHSQTTLSNRTEADVGKRTENPENLRRLARSDGFKDRRFDSFKTWSGRLERQLSNLRGRPQEVVPDDSDAGSTNAQDTEIEPAGPVEVPVHRYFAALEGPELDTLRATEELVLPKDKKWPFLLRFPISSFGICLGVSSQAILWKTLANSASTTFLHVSPTVNMALWCTALALMAAVTSTYALKIIFYFEAVRREYYHPVRVNFFFAPWIACLFLVLGAPSVAGKPHHAVWYALMTPILCLELKLYGQWMSGGQRRLSKVANPSNHLSIVGNFVGALLGAKMGLREGPIFFFAVGLAHYIVLFVTLYQRLPTNETLPKELHPVFFLFVAAPSVACTAWATIRGEFDSVSRIAYFIAMFLYFSLAVRVNFFRGFRFSLAWWAYTFPMTGAAIATIQYATAVRNPLTQSLTIVLSGTSTLTVSALLVSTMIHAFVLRNLFPNDIAIAIAISDRKRKPGKRRAFLARDLEAGSSPDNSVCDTSRQLGQSRKK